jgi:hypothetical protein
MKLRLFAGHIPYIRVSLFFNIQCSFPDISLQATGFKKLNGHGFLSLPLGTIIAPDSGHLNGRSDVKLGL